MNANNLKQNTLDFMESLEGMTTIHHVAGFFRYSQRASSHFASLRDQGFPLPEKAERLIEPPLRVLDSDPDLEPEPTPPQDPIDGNYYATQIVAHLRSFLPHASKGYRDFGKHYAVTSPEAMAERGEAIKGLLGAVIELAMEEGVIVTVERLPFPDGKPAMGHAFTRIETRWERKIYQHFMNLADTEKVMLKTTEELNRELADFEWNHREDWQKEQGGRRENYMAIGWITNGRSIKTEDELTEYLRRVAIEVGVSIFKPVPAPAPAAEWSWPVAQEAPRVREEISSFEFDEEYSAERMDAAIALCAIYDKPVVPRKHDVYFPALKGFVRNVEVKEMPDGPPAAEPIPLEVLNTIVNLAERGTPLATGLANAALEHLGLPTRVQQNGAEPTQAEMREAIYQHALIDSKTAAFWKEITDNDAELERKLQGLVTTENAMAAAQNILQHLTPVAMGHPMPSRIRTYHGHPYEPYPGRENMCQSTPNFAANPHIGSTFDSFLAEEGILGEATRAAAARTVEAGDKWTIGITVKADGSIDYHPV